MSLQELPISITHEQRSNHYVSSRLAAEAFRAAAYDFTPGGDAVARALQLGYLKLVSMDESAPQKPGNATEEPVL